MAFPDLLPKPDLRKGPSGESEIWAENTGVPVNGDNVIGIPFIANGIDPDDIDADWLDVLVEALGPSITASAFVSLAPDKQSVTINITQTGGDSARIRISVIHSLIS